MPEIFKVFRKGDSENKRGRVFKNLINNDEKFKLKTIIFFMLCVFLSSIVLIGFSMNQLKKIIDVQNTKQLEQVKNEQSIRIKIFYDLIDTKIAYYAQELANYDQVAAAAIKNHEELNYVENIYYFDTSFNIVRTDRQNLQIDQTDVVTDLKESKFTNPSYKGKYFIKNNNAYQYYFYKMVVNGSVKGYGAFIINCGFLQDVLNKDYGTIKTKIIDGNFNVLYSHEGSNIYKREINDLTKKILDGNTGTEVFEAAKNTYGYINLNETSLYINISENQNDIFSITSSVQNYMIFILIISLILTFVVAWKYIKKLKFYLEDYTHSSYYNKRIELLDELGNYLDEAENIESQLVETSEKINKFKGGIEKIKSKLVYEEGESDK